MHKLVESSYDAATTLLTEHRAKLDAVAEALLDRETLDREEFLALMEGQELTDPDEPGVQEQAMTETKEEAKSDAAGKIARGRSEHLRTPRPETSI